MTEMSMRERMARALFGLVNNEIDWDDWHPSVQDGYLAQADAVLDAMRELPQGLRALGMAGVPNEGNGPVYGKEIGVIWVAMIDAAKAGK